jgi:hypothetical protein
MKRVADSLKSSSKEQRTNRILSDDLIHAEDYVSADEGEESDDEIEKSTEEYDVDEDLCENLQRKAIQDLSTCKN